MQCEHTISAPLPKNPPTLTQYPPVSFVYPHTATAMNEIKTYNARAFTHRFMPSPELDAILKGDLTKFLICRVEDMYRHVNHAVPACRAITHSCLYLTEGTANMKVGSEHYTIGENELLFVPAGQVFSFAPGDINKGFICNFHDDMLLGKYGNSELLKEFDFLKVWGNPRITLDKETSAFIQHHFQRILSEYEQHGLQRLQVLQPNFIALLCEVNIAYKPAVTSTDNSISKRFRELVFQHVRDCHLVSEYASMMNISASHLNKTVRTTTLKSPTRWIDEAIILEAKVLLSQSEYPISEVAVQVGVEDQSYFTRLFKRYEGITPTVFRKMIKTS